MTIVLPDDLETLVQKEVAEGHFASASELVSQAVRAQLEELGAFRRTLEDAEAEGERDGWLSMDDMDKKLAARRAG